MLSATSGVEMATRLRTCSYHVSGYPAERRVAETYFQISLECHASTVWRTA